MAKRKQKIFPSGSMTDESRKHSVASNKQAQKARLQLRHARDMHKIGAGTKASVVKAEKRVLTVATKARRQQNAPQTHGTGFSNSLSGMSKLSSQRRKKRKKKTS